MTHYIAIDGHGGSGKTHIAALLANRLNAPVFDLDDYGDDFQPFIGIPALINDLRQADASIVIYEGIGVFDQNFDEFNAYRIFINTSAHIRTERVNGRDIPREDRTAADWQKIFTIWDTAEKGYFTPELVDSANLIVDNDNTVDLAIIEEKLNQFWQTAD